MPDPMASHRYAAQEEDVAFLLDAGVPYEDACRRVGVAPDALRDRLDRRALRTSGASVPA